LREVEADAGLGECAERDESEEEPVEAFALRRCEGVLEVLQQRCDRVLFYRVVPFGCYHSGWNLPQAALFLYPTDVPLSGLGWGAMFNTNRGDTVYKNKRD